MKLLRFTPRSGAGAVPRLGALDATGTGVVDFTLAAPDLPPTLRGLMACGSGLLEEYRTAAETTAAHHALRDVHLHAPIGDPAKVLAIGLNYADHAAESGREPPTHQMWFNKQANAITGHDAPVLLPAVAPDRVDYEAELVAVIGRRCRHVPRSRASEVVFGFTCGNDVSARDWQTRTPQFTLGKSFATHAPIGPWIVTADAFGDPHEKAIRCRVNGELRQTSNTRHLLFDVFDQIAELSSVFELEPGDLLFTGTPAGVGAAMQPPRFLREGDFVEVEIDGIGTLHNRVAREGCPRTRL